MEKHLLTIEFIKPCITLNTLYRTNKRNNIYKSAKGKEFNDFFIDTFKQEELFEMPLRITIEFYIFRDCDIDAKLKNLLDAMNNVIYKDDKQIVELNVKKIKVKKLEIKTIISFYSID